MIFFVDGSCRGNGRVNSSGGFGVVQINENEKVIKAYSKYCENTTNNREELKAILYVMLKYGNNTMFPVVYSDSAYCVNTFNDWMFSWERKGWIKSDKKIPENLDLIKTYYEYYQKGYRIDLRKIKGHSGEKWNEIADKLATGKINVEEVEKIYG